MIDSSVVLAYLAGGARRPWRTVTLRSPGGRKPQPGGVVVDKFGQVTVSDMANNGLYLLDSNHRFSHYRTLGHPPRASRAVGRLNRPTALAQTPQGGRFSANLYIADTGNRRVQRWNTSGYTFWSKAVRPGSGGGGGGGSSDGDGRPGDGHTMGPGGGTRILDLAEAGPSRLRFPRGTGALEAVLVNTAGGVACGDSFAIDLALEPGADLVLTLTREHRSAVVELTPAAVRRTFTLLELARIAGRTSAEPGEDLPALVARAARLRTPVPAAQDDVPDPFRRSVATHRAVLTTIEEAVGPVAGLLRPVVA